MSAGRSAGFSAIELLVGMGLAMMAMAASSSLFLASRGFMQDQALEVETTHAARSALDTLARDLRLGGACLPVTGQFVSLDGVDYGTTDEIITRTGVTRGDLSCVRTATADVTPASAGSIHVESAAGFAVGMRAYIRHTDGSGEFFTVTSVDTGSNTIGRNASLLRDYPATSGVYAVDERHYRVDTSGSRPVLTLQLGAGEIRPFATGIEALDVKYELKRNCPPCDVLDLPTGAEWSKVDQILVSVTARSATTNRAGLSYRRTFTVGVKPRNLLPQ